MYMVIIFSVVQKDFDFRNLQVQDIVSWEISVVRF